MDSATCVRAEPDPIRGNLNPLSPITPPRGVASILREAAGRLEALGSGFDAQIHEIRVLSERYDQGQFHLAVLGQFKRGKSTLLNALLGEPLLPTSVVPLTAIPTLLHPASAPAVRVKFTDGSTREFEGGTLAQRAAFLAAFVTESENPKNKLHVDQVEVHSPAPILAKGVVLIDTPGIGSTLKHNTEATLNFLPQCDAALFMVSADPPITDAEVEFLRQVKTRVPRLTFVLNKVDYLDTGEREAALNFLRHALHESAKIEETGPIFMVSARQGLEAALKSDPALWRYSGMAELEQFLTEFLAHEKTAALRSAIAKKAYEQLDIAILHLRLSSTSLQMPLTDLESRLRVFDEKLREIERERLTAQDFMAGDKKRVIAELEDNAEALRKRCRKHIEEAVLRRAALATAEGLSEHSINESLEDAIPVFFERELGEATRTFDKRVSGILRTHQTRAENLVEMVHKTAAELFDIPYRVPESGAAFQLTHRPYWVTHKWESMINPIPATWLDLFFPGSRRVGRILKRVRMQTESLIVHNVENLRWAVLRSIEDAFARYGSDFDLRLQETIAATKGAIEAALKRKRERQNEIAPEVQRLEGEMQYLRDLQAQLAIEGNMGERQAPVSAAPARSGRT